ncbi:hypothetical protein ARMSODRAFT_977521 [Armillaria solidipes]|uniref:Uncharacterized protein n=1 Tax=Armillaria solidipes TaxID=1076256 RepID=A0A2H3B6U4_9AGAR|nr:hypothetical protein ARMSODRAFT_977521 [Armillaria solidipes]
MLELDPSDPIFQGDETVLVGENGKTAMEELWDEYTLRPTVTNQQTGESSQAPLTAWRVKYYGEYELQAEDIVSQEYDRFAGRPRYSLQPQLFETVQTTLNELQAALTVAATMVPGRTT